jgi:hypothetical protein
MWNCCKPQETPYDEFMNQLDIQYKKETNQLKLEEPLFTDTLESYDVTILV